MWEEKSEEMSQKVQRYITSKHIYMGMAKKKKRFQYFHILVIMGQRNFEL